AGGVGRDVAAGPPGRDRSADRERHRQGSERRVRSQRRVLRAGRPRRPGRGLPRVPRRVWRRAATRHCVRPREARQGAGVDCRRLPDPARPRRPRAHTLRSHMNRPRVLLIGGNYNHTTMMHAIGRELAADCDCVYTPYYCDDNSVLDWMRRFGLLEFVALGHEFRRRCLTYLASHELAIDLGGKRGGYDLVVTCSDLIVPANVSAPLVGVQEGMIDPQLFWWKVMQKFPRLELPRWAAGTACTGLSHAYDAYCVASDGYRRDFIERGARADKIVVTGLPNFDDYKRYIQPNH